MTMMILKNCKEYATIWKAAIKKKVDNMDNKPILTIVQVGDVEASNRYVRNKMNDCDAVGIVAQHVICPIEITTEELIELIDSKQYRSDGVIVQLPLPDHIDTSRVTAAINPLKDVDGFRSDSKFKPCTPGGIMKYLEYCGWDPIGKNVTIIGRSDIVGKPLARMMTDADATVTLCHSKTQHIDHHLRTADLIVTAVGKAKFLNCYAIHKPVIDVGINFDENGKLCGDCVNIENRDVTPVPGGVGLLTRCMLLENVVEAAYGNQ